MRRTAHKVKPRSRRSTARRNLTRSRRRNSFGRPTQVAINQLVPPHEVRDDSKLKDILQSMYEGGWRGRPLVGVREQSTGRVLLLTGSHRYAASKAAGLESVPVVIVEKLPRDFSISGGLIYFRGKLLKGLLNKRKAFRKAGVKVGYNVLMAEVPSKRPGDGS